MTGTVFDIQRFAIHDGPGIRTLVFLKGCPLSCGWCENPESRDPKPQLLFYADKCIGCGECVAVCPGKALSQIDGVTRYDRKLCESCFSCVEVCPSTALEQCGKEMSVEEVMDIVRKDKPFYKKSGGGITLSGGEPLLQAEFSKALLSQSKKEYIPTAMETTAYASWKVLGQLTEICDLFLVDLKHMDTTIHKRTTGVDNEIILANLRQLSGKGCPLIIRIPLIPGVNSDEAQLTKTAEFVSSLDSLQSVHILPYHNLGKYKYDLLNIPYPFSDLGPPDDGTKQLALDIFLSFGLKAQIGG